jgi:hypothetical protein
VIHDCGWSVMLFVSKHIFRVMYVNVNDKILSECCRLSWQALSECCRLSRQANLDDSFQVVALTEPRQHVVIVNTIICGIF